MRDEFSNDLSCLPVFVVRMCVSLCTSMYVCYAALLRHALRRRGVIFTVSVTSHKNNISTSCENESINKFKLSRNVELPKNVNYLQWHAL